MNRDMFLNLVNAVNKHSVEIAGSQGIPLACSGISDNPQKGKSQCDVRSSRNCVFSFVKIS